ncbi:MAG: hypothetical protein D6691_05390 [Candidatus Hydrogenedentota bacterium]|jgi:two-component system sensor histidine kinase QseC|uniref:histidine kinase n=1 Tax=Sumerlaea chitinivorans TaxID=2250252 RepID=A0A2Z4Y6J5_SUMC1|nr:two-component sensor (kinase) [Candidatus Sumerlaea chitinivorans]RMH27893.1 MAG: hypothetical protein D6691_05390 [Candidatus Hydrogenedentota bacterium]GIX43989.1 MAG: hypothetical protein KatS3mg130_0397 [Candidatus Sumerlaea sp.]
MKRNRSIQATLVVGLVGALALLCILIGITTYRMVRRGLVGEFDYALLSKARAIASLVQIKANGELEFDFSGEAMREFSFRHPQEYFEIRYLDGQVLEKSESLGDHELPQIVNDKPTFLDVPLPDGQSGRAVCLTFHPAWDHEDEEETRSHQEMPEEVAPTSVTLSITLARERGTLDQRLNATLGALAVGNVLLIVAAVGVVVGVVRWALRPLHSLAAFAESVTAEKLNLRISATGLPEELVPVAQRLNDLLKRLQDAFERERRYSTDVAHELRTPLAEIRTSLEVGLLVPEDHSALRGGAQEALEAVKQAEELVSTLLWLARCEKEATLESLEAVSFVAAWEAIRESIEKQAEKRCIELAVAMDSEATVPARPSLLVACLRNIIENAVEYTPDKCKVEIAAGIEDGLAYCRVRNPAPHLTDEDVERLFEPFWRKDTSRSDRTHSGLGLTITRSLCKLMGLSVTAKLDPDGWLAISICPQRARP